jgi:two-component system, NtrC family, response regulator AtoC
MDKGCEEIRPYVAIVDNDLELAEALARSLVPFGFRAQAFRDGQTLCATLEQLRVDAVVMELHLRPMTGWELLERLRVNHPAVAVIVQAADVDVPAAVAAVRAGAFDVLQKPTRVTELQARLLDELRQRRSSLRPREAVFGTAQSASNDNAKGRDGLARLLGNSVPIARVREQIRGIARFNQVSTLVIGETGTGKELVAEALHALSAPDKPFVTINCAAIPDTLFESELFGHEAGSFTGARHAKPGLFETVGEGTLLLDEVGEMALSMQPKLLRVLQNRTFRRVGGSRDIELKARIVSATNRKLSAERQDGMRSDLYFRLAGFAIVLPPLRHRAEDIDLLANHFLLDFATQYPGVPTRISARAAELMLAHPWTGNVRELKRVVEQAAAMCTGSVLDEESVARAIDERRGLNRGAPSEPMSGRRPILDPDGVRPKGAWPSASEPPESNTQLPNVSLVGMRSGEGGLNELQQRLILEAYEANAQNLSRAARALRIPRTTLRDRLKRYGRL